MAAGAKTFKLITIYDKYFWLLFLNWNQSATGHWVHEHWRCGSNLIQFSFKRDLSFQILFFWDASSLIWFVTIVLCNQNLQRPANSFYLQFRTRFLGLRGTGSWNPVFGAAFLWGAQRLIALSVWLYFHLLKQDSWYFLIFLQQLNSQTCCPWDLVNDFTNNWDRWKCYSQFHVPAWKEHKRHSFHRPRTGWLWVSQRHSGWAGGGSAASCASREDFSYQAVNWTDLL